MNAELIKIRENKELDDEIIDEPKRMDENALKVMMYNLNSNLASLYFKDYSDKACLDDYINAFVKNIYIILEIFNEMNIYPDYFFDITLLYNIEFQKFVKDNKTMSEYELRKKFTPISNYDEKVRNGIENGYNRVRASKKRDINDYFVELVSFYQVFSLAYNKPENVKEIFKKIHAEHTNIMHNYYTSDFLYEDIEYLTGLLFSYLSFFVEIGFNPKEYLDNYIASMKKRKHK